MRIAICEDNEKDTRRLVQMIGVDHSCELYTSGEKLILDMEELSLRFDLYLLDIFLEDDENGIHLAGNIRSMDEEALICFVSTSDDFYRQAYDLYVFQYLIKPVEQQDMDRLLQRAEHQIKKNKGRAVIFERYGKPYAIPYQKLLYIASRGIIFYINAKTGVNTAAAENSMKSPRRWIQEYFSDVIRVLSSICTMWTICSKTFFCAGEKKSLSPDLITSRRKSGIEERSSRNLIEQRETRSWKNYYASYRFYGPYFIF
ncbi:response regulator [Ihubacter massiliensis]|nr:response regulator [Ihubacter massiliensis]MCO7122209.1 response regulator [Ihubacter massiliensis]